MSTLIGLFWFLGGLICAYNGLRIMIQTDNAWKTLRWYDKALIAPFATLVFQGGAVLSLMGIHRMYDSVSFR